MFVDVVDKDSCLLLFIHWSSGVLQPMLRIYDIPNNTFESDDDDDNGTDEDDDDDSEEEAAKEPGESAVNVQL